MTANRSRLPAALVLAGCLLGALWLAGSSAAGEAPSGSAQRLLVVSPQGVGALRLGATVESLHRKHLIRRLRPGCELAVGQRVARLRPPLNGFAIFNHPKKRLSSLAIEGGAQTAKHIGIGSTPAEALDAYPAARYEPPGTVQPFSAGFIWIEGHRHVKMTFIVDDETHLISSINVPSPNFCE